MSQSKEGDNAENAEGSKVINPQKQPKQPKRKPVERRPKKSNNPKLHQSQFSSSQSQSDDSLSLSDSDAKLLTRAGEIINKLQKTVFDLEVKSFKSKSYESKLDNFLKLIYEKTGFDFDGTFYIDFSKD